MSHKAPHIVVLGAAESGVGAALLAQNTGADVFVSDAGAIKTLFKTELANANIPFEEGRHSLSKILSADLIVKSPGISGKADAVLKAKNKGIKVISEIEYAARNTSAKLIGITGTNGKTTTTLLTYHILKKAGLNVGLAGNVGKSFARLLLEPPCDYYVLELSSFQLDDVEQFKADIGILLNITPDHLDRYNHQIENYVAAKFNLVKNQRKQDVFIYCADDPLINSAKAQFPTNAQSFAFSIKSALPSGAWLEKDNIHIQINNQQDPLIMSIFDLALQGKHNIYNSMAAGVAARILEIRKETVRESLMDFENVEHRLEFVAKIHGIEFINDSKATNVNSAWYALESMNHPVVWIAGGVDKGNDYELLKDMVAKKVKAIVCMGKDNSKLHTAFGGAVPRIVDTFSARDAVRAAYSLAKKGDVVLLSPACASFDLFENYEDRGRQFKQAVKEL